MIFALHPFHIGWPSMTNRTCSGILFTDSLFKPLAVSLSRAWCSCAVFYWMHQYYSQHKMTLPKMCAWCCKNSIHIVNSSCPCTQFTWHLFPAGWNMFAPLMVDAEMVNAAWQAFRLWLRKPPVAIQMLCNGKLENNRCWDCRLCAVWALFLHPVWNA